MNTTITFIALFGALGVLFRYFLHPLNSYSAWPLGTFTANMIGCFLIFYLYSLKNFEIAPAYKTAIIIGLLGGLTTFSSYLYELFQMFSKKQWSLAIGYLVATHVGAISLGFLAIKIAKRI